MFRQMTSHSLPAVPFGELGQGHVAAYDAPPSDEVPGWCRGRVGTLPGGSEGVKIIIVGPEEARDRLARTARNGAGLLRASMENGDGLAGVGL